LKSGVFFDSLRIPDLRCPACFVCHLCDWHISTEAGALRESRHQQTALRS
jgi:hypothetical protein